MRGRCVRVFIATRRRYRGERAMTPAALVSPARRFVAGMAPIASPGVYDAFTPCHRGGSGAPLVCLHGFTDTWRTWELVLPALQREHDVLAPTLAGHAGGPPVKGEASAATIADAVERAMDHAGFATAHIVGNSLGGFIALQLAARGRAESVVALAPAGGWAQGDEYFRDTLAPYFRRTRRQLMLVAPHAEAMLSTSHARQRATQLVAVNYEHIPAELLAHQLRGVVACDGADAFVEHASRTGWQLDAERIECPVRVVWGTQDRLLLWPAAARRFREDWLAHADWIELDGVGHCPQLDVPLETAQLILGFTG
jgi:pimeloyl-ACP methyl ester carboxylesterase